MNTKAIFTIVAIVASDRNVGYGGQSAIPSVLQAHADAGGIPNLNAGDNPFKHCDAHPGETNHCGNG